MAVSDRMTDKGEADSHPLRRIYRKIEAGNPWKTSAIVIAVVSGLAIAVETGIRLSVGLDFSIVSAVFAVLMATLVVTPAVHLASGAFREVDATRKALAQNAQHDELTGLKNRRGFYQFGEVEILRARRLKTPFSVALVEVDQVRKIYTGYGDEGCDQVLSEMAKVLKAGAREYDMVARFGGAQFLLLLPEADHRTAARVVSRHFDAVRKYRFEHQGKRLIVTLSGGLATYSEARSPAETLTNLVRRASIGLQRAKDRGADRCCVGPLVSDELADLPRPIDAEVKASVQAAL